MKRMSQLLVIAVLVACLPLAVIAGDYHTGTTLNCSDCHVMHFSQAHSYTDSTGAGSAGTDWTSLGSTPQAGLLRNDVNSLCLTCHNGQSTAPDVLGANTLTYVRQAGALNQDGDGASANGHTLDQVATAPGGTWTTGAGGLQCAQCHEPHGVGSNYRNLRTNPGGATGVSVTYTTGTTNVTTTDVWQTSGPDSTIQKHYATSNIRFNEPTTTASAYANFCKGCHTNFHGTQGGSELGGTGGTDWIRHPTADANIGEVGDATHSAYATFSGHTNNVQVMSASGTWPATDNTPSCMSCHKAHGNQNAFGLIHMSGSGTITEEGDNGTTVKALCKQCHIQG
jgi:hypothetical protein